MALSGSSSRGTADPVDVEYLNFEPEDAPVGVHMHLDAVDGIARDVIEGIKALPRRGVEVGGLLLGKVIGSEVWIERYQRIECEHRFGPQFALDAQDHAELERAAQRIAETTELAVVGLYRSHTRPGFQLEESDMELVGRYFSDPCDLVILIRPEDAQAIAARLFARNDEGEMQPIGDPFPFRGRILGSGDSVLRAGPAPAGFFPAVLADFRHGDNDDVEDPSEVTRATESTRATDMARGADLEGQSSAAGGEASRDARDAGPPAPDRVAASPAPPRERIRRLVPDFAPAPPSLATLRDGAAKEEPAKEPVEPGGVFSFDVRSREDARAAGQAPRFTIESEPSIWRRLAARWWPLTAAIALVCAAVSILFTQSRHSSTPGNAPTAKTAEEYRPVGMYVDPGPQRWRISWNSSATAFANARSVALFVRDGDAEDRVDLTRQDVQQGIYSWQPKGNDVTFRIEAIDASGRISAESFRVINRAPTAPAAANAAPAPAAPSKPAPEAAAPHMIPARATHKVPPVVPASIRPRIRGLIPIDVRVHIDARGRVVSATPVSRPASGLNAYLAARALYAARLWRFVPARENGKAVSSAQTIHFVFEK